LRYLLSIACALLVACGGRDDAPPAPNRPAPTWPSAIELNVAKIEIATGHSNAALVKLTRARDRVLRAWGDHDPRLALYDDALATALRARGKLRDAKQRSDQSLALREAAFGRDSALVATSLLGRAQSEIEGGELAKASEDLRHARAIDPHIPTVDVLLATADPFAGVAQAGSDDDPAVAAAVGEKLLAAGDKAGATRVLKAAVAQLGEEPTRTALRIYIALARASGDPQAARAAISAYQAMPELERSAEDEMWAISRR